MAKPAYFTICSKNYLAYALTLGRSLRDADPQADFTIFLADSALDPQAGETIEFDTVAAEALDLENLADMALRYSIMEFNTAIKPACFQHLFTVKGAGAAVYLDPDILVVRPLKHVEAALADGAELVLTPHSLSPLDDGGDPDDLRLLRTGVYNLGFAAFSDSAQTRGFLDWWNARLATDCRVALDDGIFVDQKWMDLAPCYVAATHILRHPGYNAAYWNLHGRPVEHGAHGWTAGGEPLHFFHFSGVRPGDGETFSKHQNRFGVEDIGALKTLLHDYLQRLERNGHAAWSAEPYAFSTPADMAGIDSFARAAFRRRHHEPIPDATFDPARLEAVCNAPCQAVDAGGEGELTNLTYEIWAQRPDLRRLFDLSRSDDRARFRTWLLTSGAQEHRIPERFLRRPDDMHAAPRAREPWRTRLLHEALKRRSLVKPLTDRLPARWVDAGKRRVQALMRPAPPKAAMIKTEAPHAREPRPEIALAVYGYFKSEGGLGQAVRREFRALRSNGVPAAARLLKAPAFANAQDFEFAFDAEETDARIHLLHVNADQVAHAEAWASAEAFDPRRYRIGYWAWELERFPDAWADAFTRVDEIWTPSRFVADAVSAATDKPVHVFAHPVAIPPPAGEASHARRRFALPAEATLFLTVFDFNSFTDRKNPHAVLDAFERARASAPHLGLVMKCHGGGRHDREREALFRRARGLSNVFIVDRVLDGPAMDELYAACDGLISLHRSEGFGLTVAEAMARALPVIATHYSGVADFFDADVGEAIGHTLIDVAPGAYPHGDGARWAEPDIEAAAAALARLALDPARRAELGAKGRERVAEQLSPDRVGRLMSARIAEILDTLDADRAAAPHAAQ